jgi:flagellar operon protein
MNPIVNEFAPLSSSIDYSKGQGFESPKEDAKVSFKFIYQNAISDSEKVNFSKHANERLLSRELNVSDEQMRRLNDGVLKAREKNIKDSLIIVDDLSFVVNIPNNTVITALKSQEERNVFTNIDGAVIS